VDFAELAVSGLASMYPAFDWSAVLLAIMDISARAISLADRPRLEPFGSPVFAGAGKTEPPFRFILSQTSAGKAFRSGYVIAGSSFCAVPVVVGVE